MDMLCLQAESGIAIKYSRQNAEKRNTVAIGSYEEDNNTGEDNYQHVLVQSRSQFCNLKPSRFIIYHKCMYIVMPLNYGYYKPNNN